MYSALKRLLIGSPLSSEKLEEQRLNSVSRSQCSERTPSLRPRSPHRNPRRTRAGTRHGSARWLDFNFDIPLDIVSSPYRALTRPVLEYVEELDNRWDNDVVTVIVPEFVAHHWWEQLLHNQSALLLKARLLFRKGTVVTSVPAHVD